MAGPKAPSQDDVIVALPDAYEPIIPTGWRWLVGIYLVVPLVLLALRPEIIPDTAPKIAAHYGTTVLATLGIGGLVHAVYAWPMPRLLPRLKSWPLRLLTHALAITGSVMLGKAIVGPILHTYCHAYCHHELRHDEPHEMMVAVVAAIVVVAAASTYTQLRRRTQRIAQLEAQARQAALNAQLEALQARTNPHFLFNSLNTVASLIPTDPKVAEETVLRLADLFRYTLQSARRPSVKLSDELAVVRDYLEIEQLRLGDRLAYDITVDAALERWQVPPLMLQPLVENAILHGIACKRRGGHIAISAQVETAGSIQGDHNFVLLRVEDKGSEPTTQAHAGTGTALTDLERRIALTYGAEATLEKEMREHGYCVTLRIPRVTPQPTPHTPTATSTESHPTALRPSGAMAMSRRSELQHRSEEPA